MTSPTRTFRLDRADLRALLVGAALGSVAWSLSAAPGAGDRQLAMALVMIFAGCASFVAHALHQRGVTARQGIAALRVWVCALGGGVCLSMAGMQWLMG